MRLILFLLLCSAIGCNNPTKKHSFIIEQHFPVGKKQLLTIDYSKYDSKDSSKADVTTNATFEVVKYGITGDETTITYGETEFSDVRRLVSNNTMISALSYKKGLTIKLLLDKNGRNVGILNFDSLQTGLKNNLSRSYKALIPGITDKQIKETFDMIPSINDENGIIGFFPEIDVFLGILGDTINIDSVRHFKPSTYNPIDGSVISMDAIEKVMKIDKDTLLISVSEELSKVEAEKFVKSISNDDIDTNKEYIGGEIALTIQMNLIYHYDISRHVIKEASMKRVYSIDRRKVIEIYKITPVE